VVKRVIRVSVAPGRASQNPTLAQALQPYGVDPGRVIEEVNRRTKVLSNYNVSNLFVEIEVDPSTGSFEVKPELPPVTELILRSIGRDSGAHQAGKEVIGDISMEKLAEIAYIKWDELRSRDFRAALRQVVAACRSLGVTIEGRDPRDVDKELTSGGFKDLVSKYEGILRSEGRL